MVVQKLRMREWQSRLCAAWALLDLSERVRCSRLAAFPFRQGVPGLEVRIRHRWSSRASGYPSKINQLLNCRSSLESDSPVAVPQPRQFALAVETQDRRPRQPDDLSQLGGVNQSGIWLLCWYHLKPPLRIHLTHSTLESYYYSRIIVNR